MKKVKGYEVTNDEPKEGDSMICVQRKNINYGLVVTATKQQVELNTIDKTNWKVIKK